MPIKVVVVVVVLERAFTNFEHAPSNIMVVHLGENDLTIRKGKSLILQVIHDLWTLKDKFFSRKLFWSNIIPRLVWRAD